MEAAGLALSAVQTLFATLQCSEVKDLFSFSGYRSELESLQKSVLAIQALLKDADNKQALGVNLSAVEQNFIKQIKEVVYDADDLLAEYATKARLQQFRMERGQKIFRKVRRLYHHFKNLRLAHSKSPEVKETAKKLAEIARNAGDFQISCPAIKATREETCSHVNEGFIIGREDDKKRIVDLLLDPNMKGHLPALAIVGMGGLGKTTLAQLVYNDPRIQKEFPLKLWICVSNQDPNQLDVKAVLTAIYESATASKDIDGLALNVVVQQLGRVLNQKKYLLVFDDLWNEKPYECDKLVDILVSLVQRGSRILVTTRSTRTANAIGSNQPYELQGLSDEDSWRLFEINVGREKANSGEYIEMGKDIVKQCANVPLAIKVIGSLLRGQDEKSWSSLRQRGLAEIKDGGNEIMSILKFSYYHLSSSLKNCFTYCALFPKGLEIKKERIMNLWMAHDYVEPYQGQSIEEAAEDHFNILVQRCFFQVVEECEIYGKLFKIHDLMREMAQEMAGDDFSIVHSARSDPGKSVRHVYDTARHDTEGFITGRKIRTYVRDQDAYVTRCDGRQFLTSNVIENWKGLRALVLRGLDIRCLPDAIGKLLHLRHLDLSLNSGMKMLPDSLTDLINLQSLNLYGCNSLEELPKDFSKLVGLRALYVGGNGGIKYMPFGMEKLTRLSKLDRFAVGQEESGLKRVAGRDGLRAPRSLRGHLKICIDKDYKHIKGNCGEGGYLCNTECLNSVCIEWLKPGNAIDFFMSRLEPDSENEEEREDHAEDLFEDLQPHCNLTELEVLGYPGVRIPKWAGEYSLTTSLPNLVKIVLRDCPGLKELSMLGKLPYLKFFELSALKNLEYVENETSSINSGIGSYEAAPVTAPTTSSMSAEVMESSRFFPSLKELYLICLPKLKGWCRGSTTVGSASGLRIRAASGHRLRSFPRLSQLTITQCPNLTSIPMCPMVETLKLHNFNGSLRIMIDEEEDQKEVGRKNESGKSLTLDPIRRALYTEDVGHLKSVPQRALQCVTQMNIFYDHKVKYLSECAEVFHRCLSSLRTLAVVDCNNLRSGSGVLEYLTVLESLTLSGLPELCLDETREQEEEEDLVTSTPWKCLGQCLHSLELRCLDKVVCLPRGMRHLTALQSLEIALKELREIPEWIACLSSLQSLTILPAQQLVSLPEAFQKLTSLQRLEIFACTRFLYERCKEPDGEDWPKIKHIPHVNIFWLDE